MIHENLLRAFAGFFGLVAGEVDEINGARAGEEIKCAKENEEGRANDNRNEVELEMLPEIIKILEGKCGKLSCN